jgi:dihydroorotase/N-acyl-D-amino-acid deacylase
MKLKTILLRIVLPLAVISAMFTLFHCAGPEFDLIIKNGTIVDGLGGEPYKADVGIKGDIIKQVGSLDGKKARKVIDASGLSVCPGFIDLHHHGDRTILDHPDGHNYIHQGVTTVLTGNCGGSKFPVGEFLDSVEKKKIALNFSILVGHNTVRREVMGNEARDPEPEELDKMKALVEQAMKDGAVGMSTGLKYTPGTYAKTAEVVELAKVVAKYGGFYASHMREEGIEVLESVAETINIGKLAGLPVLISHHKVVSVDKWGSSVQTLSMVDKAREEGVDVMMDQYPYPATSTGLTVLYPSWAIEGEEDTWKDRWLDPANNQRLKAAIKYNIEHDRGGSDLDRIMIARYTPEPELEGLTIKQILVKRGQPVNMENGVELIIQLKLNALGEDDYSSGIYFCLSDDDIERIMQHPYTAHASDGSFRTLNKGNPHPRNYGTFPRVLRLYVREKGILTFKEAIRKMTSLPAKRLGLTKRGRIKEGCYADITIVNPKTVADTATWEKPHQYPKGIPYVIVNGQPVIENSAFTGQYPGKVLCRK